MHKLIPATLALLLAVVVLPAADPPKVEQTEAGKKALEKIRQLGGLALEVAQNDNRLEVSYLQTDGKFSDDYLTPLKELKGLVHLNLRGQPVTDAQLANLKDITSLTELHLEKTKVTDKGLENLKGLVNLEYLNLYGTEVSDAGLANLEGMKKLKHLYLWQTKVTEGGAAKLKKALPDVDINLGIEKEKPAVATLQADEGMWLFTNPPRQQLKDKYKFDVTQEWLDHVQRASVRFNNGGSGSFVSPDGLILTNHHVGADSLEKKGDDKHDYLRDGFHAKTQAEELKCEDLELNVLMKIEDVTDKVNAAVTPDLSPEKAAAARRDVIARIKKEANDKTKLRCDVVTLYQGGQYHLYEYKKYTDVRIVFAPEQQIAFYGGDPDNFEYPRYDLDICLFRAYEDGKPAKIEHYLKWSKDGAKDNELVFVSGHPGRTRRLTTVAELEYLRDTDYPYTLQRLNRAEVMLMSFSGRSTKNAQEAKETLFSVQNSRKARIGGLGGLLDPEFMALKKDQEQKLKAAAEKDNSFKNGSPWDRIANAMKVRKANLHRYTVLEGRAGFNSQLYGIARALLRGGDERPKPNGERLSEFEESGLESLTFQLFSGAPIYEDFETVKLADSLTFLATELGADDPLVQKVLNGKAPAERAAQLVNGTKLKDVALRKKLWEGGKDAVAAAKDPMIELARLVDPEARAVRKTIENEVDEVLQQAYADIAKVKFKLEGTSTYPDATFTLRLSYGVVKGYEENGKPVPFETKIGGLFERAKAAAYKEPFDLPERWMKIAKDPKASKLNMGTPFNFVCTADIIGGNSGSPVINKDAEFVGIIFDGNIQSLVLDFAYTQKEARAVSVHSQGIIECLRHVYDANELADELTGKAAK